jgi:hypothetical protein
LVYKHALWNSSDPFENKNKLFGFDGKKTGILICNFVTVPLLVVSTEIIDILA